MADDKKLQAKTFYLNEQHEVARSEKEGAGARLNMCLLIGLRVALGSALLCKTSKRN